MEAPVALYVGAVSHARLRPRRHRFAYRVFSILIDLDRLDEAEAASVLFSVDRPNVLSFRQRDHGARDGSPLRNHVDTLLTASGIPVEGARVFLLCHPRVLGFAFNPLSVYIVQSPDGCPTALVYEVRNTFGEAHSYVVRVRSSERGAPLRHRLRKAFHVSPFLRMDARYDFSLAGPGERLRLLIRESDDDGPLLLAAYTGERRELTDVSALEMVLRMPFMTLKVVAAIHWEAVRLWAKGLPVHPHPRRRSAGPTAPAPGMDQCG